LRRLDSAVSTEEALVTGSSILTTNSISRFFISGICICKHAILIRDSVVLQPILLYHFFKLAFTVASCVEIENWEGCLILAWVDHESGI
jgi:hypothetical protein